MSQPTGPRPSNVPLGPSEAQDRVSAWSADDAVETFFAEPTDIRARFAEAARPPSTSSSSLGLTYEPYYGLKEKAFSLSTDPKFLYKSGSHAPVFHELLAAIRRREGLIVLTGDIGAGKTTLCRAVLGHLDRKTFTTFVPDPFVSREDLLKMLLVEFGVVSIEDVRRGRLKGASRVELSYPLYEFLKSLGPLDAFAVLVIDEAQNLPLPLLEEIRILSDLEDGRKLLQVVLVGQPEFRSYLKLPRMKQVDQRVSMRCELRPLTREGVANYVVHRLSTAGGTSDRVAFAPASLDLIFDASGGIPRVINLICDRALERGHREDVSSISPGLVAGAIRDLQLGESSENPAIEPLESVTDPIVVETSPAPLSAAPLVASSEPIAPVEERSALPAASQGPRGLFEKQSTAAEATARTSDLHMLLDLAPTTTRIGASIPSSATVAGSSGLPPSMTADKESPSSAFAQNLRRGRARRFGLLTTMSLATIGTLTGVSLVAYLLWMGPFLRERPALPPAPEANRSQTPSGSSAGSTPAVTPAPGATATPGEPAQGADPNQLARGRWAVQVAAFASSARASAVVQQLVDAGFPAYEGRTSSNPDGLRLVLIGPYRSTEEAETMRARVRQIPDFNETLIRDLETGENF